MSWIKGCFSISHSLFIAMTRQSAFFKSCSGSCQGDMARLCWAQNDIRHTSDPYPPVTPRAQGSRLALALSSKVVRSCCFCLMAFLSQPAWATLKVVTTTPDLASIAAEVGGERVHVLSLCEGYQNPHFVEAKPSLILKLMKADLLIQVGLDLEIGWVPLLIQGARNSKILPGTLGFLDASEVIEPLDVPTAPSRAMGDVHPGGNPHYLTDPENGRLVARLMAKRLSQLAPNGREIFERNLKSFEARLNEYLREWFAKMEPYRGSKFVSYHRDWPYFCARFGLVSVGEIEPKPGIPPGPFHTAKLMERIKAEGVRLILTHPWYEKRTPGSIAQATGAKVLVMAFLPGSVPEAKDYISCIHYNVESIVGALALNKDAVSTKK